jgi:hypothetical protein
MNRSMETMPAVAEQTSSKVSESIGSKGMGGAFSETRGNLNSLTGGMMGFLPLMAGMSLVSAVGQFDALAKSVQSFKVMSGTSAEDASKWVGVANIYGIATNSLSMAMKGLEQHQESLQTTFNKTTGSGVAASIAMDKLKTANDEYNIASQKVATDQEKLNTAVDKYGKNSIKAQSATQTLETAQAHLTTTQAGILRAQDEYNKATGQTNDQLSTVQLAAQRLGITLINNKGQMTSQTQILMEMADAYTKTGGSVQTVSDITAILGGRAKALLPMFAEGSQGIKDAMAQTASAGLVMSQSQLSVGVATGKLMNDIKENIKSLFVGIGQFLTPVFDFVDKHVKVFVDLGGAILIAVAAIKLFKFGEGVVSDAGKLLKSFQSMSGLAGTVKNMITGNATTGGVANKIIGAQVTVAVFGPEAFEQLKLASGGGVGGSNPLNNVTKDAPAIEAAAAPEEAGIMAKIFGSSAFAAVSTTVGVGMAGMVTAEIVGLLTASQSQREATGKARENIGTGRGGGKAFRDILEGKGTGGDQQNEAAAQQAADQAEIHLTAQQVLSSWQTISSSTLDSQTHILAWEQLMRPTLSGQLVAGSDTTVAMDDIARLVKAHQITNATTLAQYESDWNHIQLSTGKTAPQAQTLFEQMLAAKSVTAQQAPAYITAWNTLVKDGIDPASINAQEVATQIKLAASLVALLHANLQVDNNIPGVTLPNGKVIKYATGGLINEHIVGIGQKSGTQYHFGEAGNEAVIPMSGASGGEAAQPISLGSSGGGGGDVMIVHVSFPNSLTFLNNANQIDELSKAIESRLATVRLPHRGVRMSPH